MTLTMARMIEVYGWLYTSGMGVSWLHGRIDQVPKYYDTFHEFANE